MKRFLIPAIMVVIGLILVFTGSRLGGPVYTKTIDKRAALLAHDTVPALEQNGDSTLYRFETTRKFGADMGYTIVGLALIVGGIGFAVKRRNPNGESSDEVANTARDFWKCRACGFMNRESETVCRNCKAARTVDT